jgi:VIT1/CCC1 family predicted Fe2+/Mn2+ transporter
MTRKRLDGPARPSGSTWWIDPQGGPLVAQETSEMQPQIEKHRTGRSGWLRAAVLGADDGILSTASLMLGVATAGGAHGNLLIAGVAGLVAGAMSMAAGEYVSVHSQADTEQADLALEQTELTTDDSGEHRELAAIYIARGLTPDLAKEVAQQLMAHDALAAHARDELGITDTLRARPIQAAAASAISFSSGALIPLLAAVTAPQPEVVIYVSLTSLVCLAALGALAAYTGGANMISGILRATCWGALAMVVTAGAGALFGPLV